MTKARENSNHANDLDVQNTDLNTGIVTPNELSTGHPTWDTSGKVGIGTSTPTNSTIYIKTGDDGITVVPPAATSLTVENSTSAFIQMLSPNSTYKGLFFNDDTDPDGAQFRYLYDGANGRYEWRSGAAERMRLDSDGLKFNGDTAAANALNDYEEGTWTPGYTAATNFTSVTYDPQVGGRYTKIGNMVYVTGTVYTDAISGGSGAVYISGLPFIVAPASNGTDDRGSLTINQMEAFAGDFPHIAQCVGGTNNAGLKYKTIPNGQNYSLQVTDMGTGANANLLRFSGFYTTNQ